MNKMTEARMGFLSFSDSLKFSSMKSRSHFYVRLMISLIISLTLIRIF